MFEWTSDILATFIITMKNLLTDPSRCEADDLLLTFNIFIGIYFIGKYLLHKTMSNRLKKQFQRYQSEDTPGLLMMARVAAHQMGLKKLPDLFRFDNKYPFVFAIGSFKPAIFISPSVLTKLSENEKKALLVHELTHIKRKDNLYIWLLDILATWLPALLVQIGCVAYVYYGDVRSFEAIDAWWTLGFSLFVTVVTKRLLWPQILFWREISCDDISVEIIKDPLVLASSILNVWKMSQTGKAYSWRDNLLYSQGFWHKSGKLEKRIERLLNYKAPQMTFFLGKVMRFSLNAGLAGMIFLSVFLYANIEEHTTERISAVKKNCPGEATIVPIPQVTPAGGSSCTKVRSAP